MKEYEIPSIDVKGKWSVALRTLLNHAFTRNLYVHKFNEVELNNLEELLIDTLNYLTNSRNSKVVREQDYLRVLSISKEVGKIRPTFLAKLKLLGHTV